MLSCISEVKYLDKGLKIIAQNKKAWHDYFILETLETGIELVGTEVKSVRLGKVNLKDCHAAVHKGELFVYGMHISPYEQGNIFNKDPLRTRKLLAHRSEINKLAGKISQDGLTLVPLKIYLKNGRIKLELGLAKGKKLYDKRADAAKRATERDIDRIVKERNSV